MCEMTLAEHRADRLRRLAWAAYREAEGARDADGFRDAARAFTELALACAAAGPEEQTLAAWSVKMDAMGGTMEGRTPSLAHVARELVRAAAGLSAVSSGRQVPCGPDDTRMIGRLTVDWSAGAAGARAAGLDAATNAAAAEINGKKAKNYDGVNDRVMRDVWPPVAGAVPEPKVAGAVPEPKVADGWTDHGEAEGVGA